VVARVARARGVRSAEPLVAFRHVARVGSDQRVVNVIAVPRGGIVRPRLVAGRPIRSAGEVVADERARFDIGDTFTLGRHRLRVVGLVRNLTYFGGTPTLLLSLGDGRRIAYDGRALASAVITRGVPVGPLPGLRVMDRAAVRDDLMRPMRAATSTIAVLALLLSVVAAGIVGLMTYMSGLDRLVDFAVFKAIGVRTGRLLGGLVLQSLTLALGSALAATVAAIAIKPVFPIVVHLSLATCSMLVGLALLVGLLVSLVSIRQCAHVDPAIAFGRH
jgi:putative ABC transport system permease protein